MEVYISDQLRACAAFAVLGLISCAAYDILRTLRVLIFCENESRSPIKWIGRFLDLCFDLLFMTFVSISFTVLAYCYSYGKVRWFGYACFAVCFVLYRITVSRLYRSTLLTVFLKGKKLAIHLVLLCVRPVKLMLRFTLTIIFWVFSKTFGALIRNIISARDRSRLEKILPTLDVDVRF